MLLNTVYPALSGLPIGKIAYISGGCSQHTGCSRCSLQRNQQARCRASAEPVAVTVTSDYSPRVGGSACCV